MKSNQTRGGKRRRAGPPQLTRGLRLHTYLQRVLSPQRQHKRRRTESPSAQASTGRTPLCKGPGWRPRAARGGCRTHGQVSTTGRMARRPGREHQGQGWRLPPAARPGRQGDAGVGGGPGGLRLPRAQPGRAQGQDGLGRTSPGGISPQKALQGAGAKLGSSREELGDAELKWAQGWRCGCSRAPHLGTGKRWVLKAAAPAWPCSGQRQHPCPIASQPALGTGIGHCSQSRLQQHQPEAHVPPSCMAGD